MSKYICPVVCFSAYTEGAKSSSVQSGCPSGICPSSSVRSSSASLGPPPCPKTNSRSPDLDSNQAMFSITPKISWSVWSAIAPARAATKAAVGCGVVTTISFDDGSI